ncbi:carboxymuconolactone decarboxylase family protein [Variovorax sp. dw_954]|uniref:carboxymuconolactone decarboxylase family protein n=1 Tax=Variovorax sp. dw_954 TaxID=2720078 RepID=UPI001BD24397|nr:carboxymuconolactone decarboxylase family protein [Variovorax sp. dw_954]
MTQRLDHLALTPEGMRGLNGLYHHVVTKSGLPQMLIDLVYLRASQINGCAYCIAMHSRDLLKAEMPVQKLMLLSTWREAAGLFDAREQAALRWAEAVTLISEQGAPDADYEAAMAQFSPKELVELTLAIGVINAYNRMAISFRRTPEGVPAS